ncbi:putative toxin-antitoxin system, toxin component, PrlF [Desulfonema limicola]|uniref:Toxin-antitoxin system, toxin component, PrlF n=1 Tax=Desulfonema limicola TaxID=45656 RepID=A0A975GJ26_9BACT|nr:type II toxin-antitoxin system PrlF family antitoxin [Desulfonema limicola]QTA83081.1 putative toxin-antitoxin system, toxin component, PrlF [Desulfonema limicola]
MTKTITTNYDVAEHLRNTDEMAAYLEASFEEANGDGSVLMSRANKNEEDPVLAQFLTFLANDISQNSHNVSAIDSDLLDRVSFLVSDVEIDLDSPLSDKDE